MNDQTDYAPLTDQRLDEIQARAANLGCPDCGCRDGETRRVGDEDVPALVAEIRRLRGNLATVTRRHAMLESGFAEVYAERNEGYARIADARAEIRKQDVASQGMWCTDVSDALAAVEAHLVDPQYRAARHRSPGYQGEIPDHHGPADTCAMPACATARAQHADEPKARA